MATATDDLLTRIAQLADAEVLEAGRYYLARRVSAESAEEVDEAIDRESYDFRGDPEQLRQLQELLAEDSASTAELIRFLLRVGASESESQRQQILEALDGVGQKQIVIETAVVLALGILTSLYLIHKTGGKKSESEHIEIETAQDGRVTWKYNKEVVYADQASILGQFFNWLRSFPGFGAGTK